MIFPGDDFWRFLVFYSCWFNTGYMFSSVYGGFGCISRAASLVVDTGSGVCWLVLLVTIHLVLCFLRLSMSVAIPQVQFLAKVICPLLFCLVLLVRQCRKLWIFCSCRSSLVVDILVMVQRPIPKVLLVRKTIETPLRSIFPGG